MYELSVLGWSGLVVAALLIGVAKTAVGGVATISVAIFATVLPARESTGALLPLLLVGDLVAVGAYRRHADWAVLLRLFPSVAAGVGAGVLFVAVVDDVAMRRTIGAVLVVLTALHLWQRRPAREHVPEARPPRWVRGAAPALGVLAGFTTMVANAGGPVMTLYLLSAGFGMLGFLGTGACFFLVVNAFKVPFSVGLGLISVESLTMNAALVPAVLIGAAVGRVLVRHLDQLRFERLVLAFSAVASLNLLR